jgi:ABC-type branched-subunit amino acid transport system ATPase component
MSAGLMVEGLAAGYGGFRVLDGVTLTAAAGKLTAVLGPNGAGKTTLLKAIAGLIGRDGQVRLGDTTLTAGQVSVAVKAGLALVPEGRQLFPDMTVRENLELGGYLLPRAERAAALERVLALFPRLAERQGQRAGTMSGGEQQMLAVGRALIREPRVIMLDEPSLGLAPRMVDEVLAIAVRARDAGITVLLVEQNVAKALAIADHAYVLERGRIAMQGPAGELARSERIREAYLGATSR